MAGIHWRLNVSSDHPQDTRHISNCKNCGDFTSLSIYNQVYKFLMLLLENHMKAGDLALIYEVTMREENNTNLRVLACYKHHRSFLALQFVDKLKAPWLLLWRSRSRKSSGTDWQNWRAPGGQRNLPAVLRIGLTLGGLWEQLQLSMELRTQQLKAGDSPGHIFSHPVS